MTWSNNLTSVRWLTMHIWCFVDIAEMRSETDLIRNLQTDFDEVGKVIGAFLQKQEAFPAKQKPSIGTSNIGINCKECRLE